MLVKPLTLPDDTLVIEKNETAPEVNLSASSVTKIGLRYWPEKGAEPRVKWLPTEVGQLIETTINELTELTSAARKVALWLETHPERLDSQIEPNTLLDMKQVGKFVGVKNGVQYCRNRNLPIIEESSNGGSKKWFIQYQYLEKAILEQKWKRPMLRLPNGKTQSLSKSLCVVYFDQLRDNHSSIRWLVRPISETNMGFDKQRKEK